MGLHIYWEDEEKLFIRQVYDMTWTWDEYLAAFEKIRQLAAEVDYPVGLIAELGHIRRVPPNAIVYGARGIRSLPSNIALAVMITPSQLAQSLLRVILTITQFENVTTAASVDEARQLITQKRSDQLTIKEA